MERKKYFGAPLWWHWTRTGLVLLLFAEYARLVLTTDAAPHRAVIAVVLGLAFGVSLITLIRAIRRRARGAED